jgi:hypothetical protein
MLAKVGQHAIGFELQQVLSIRILSRFERPPSQPHMIQGKRMELDGSLFGLLSGIVIERRCRQGQGHRKQKNAQKPSRAGTYRNIQ